MKSAFLGYIEEFMTSRRYARKTTKTYIYWIRFFINYNKKRHPNELGDEEVQQFLSYLSNQRNVAVKTQATALNALSFMYRHIILRPLSKDLYFNKARQAQKLPVVLTRAEVNALLVNLSPKYKLIAQLMYGSGLRLNEALKLRVQDIDFDYLCVNVWQG